MFLLKPVLFCAFLSGSLHTLSQSGLQAPRDAVDTQWHSCPDGSSLGYTRPARFGFLTQVPEDARQIIASSFRKENLKPVCIMVGATGLLFLADQSVADGVEKFSKDIRLQASEDYKDILSVPAGKKDISLLKAPRNANTAIYQLGQGFPGLLIGSGLFIFGKINHDYRAANTASQLAESFILMGVGTQLLKRISGRESPSEATQPRGAWRPFPSFRSYQQHTPKYDAFPSGHLATMISSVTVLADNYPEYKWIRPAGYSLTGLLGYAMINNKVHWVSDYPLALALGYACAKQVTRHNRKLRCSPVVRRPQAHLSLTFQYAYRQCLPGLRYSF